MQSSWIFFFFLAFAHWVLFSGGCVLWLFLTHFLELSRIPLGSVPLERVCIYFCLEHNQLGTTLNFYLEFFQATLVVWTETANLPEDWNVVGILRRGLFQGLRQIISLRPRGGDGGEGWWLLSMKKGGRFLELEVHCDTESMLGREGDELLYTETTPGLHLLCKMKT